MHASIDAAASRIAGLRPLALSPQAGLAVAALLWAGNFVVGRALQGRVDPLEFNFWRWSVALLVLLPCTAPALRRQAQTLRRHWRFVAGLGLSGLALPHVCIYEALRTTPTLNAVLWLNQAPLLVMLGAWAFYGHRPRAAQWIGLATAMAGALVLLSHGRVEALQALQWHAGDLWMLPAVVGAATHILLLRRTPPGVTQGPLLAASAAAALLWMTPLVLWRGGMTWPQPPSLWLAVLYVGVMASAVAFWLWNRGVAAVGPVKAAPRLLLMPFFGSLLSLVLLGEGVQPHQLVGAALVLAGLWLGRPRAPAR